MLDVPEEGYKLPLKLVNNLYNQFFVPNHDWIDRIEFDEFTPFKFEKLKDYLIKNHNIKFVEIQRKSGKDEIIAS